MPSIAPGDAIGNYVLALQQYLVSCGYDAEIYAEKIAPELKSSKIKKYTELPELLQDDILFYHFSIGSSVMEKVLRTCACRKIMIYHNITPSIYFEKYNPGLARLVEKGREQLRSLSDIFECCLTVSEFNKQDLRREGYDCPIGVLPILISFDDYKIP